MVPFLDLFARFEQRLDQVIKGCARSDGDHVGAYDPTDFSDRMASHALQVFPAVNLFPPRRIAPFPDTLDHGSHLRKAEAGLHGLETACLLDRSNEFLGPGGRTFSQLQALQGNGFR